MKHTIDHLILRAKALSNGRGRNEGRPREIMPPEEAKVVSQLRRHNISINSIHRVMVENDMTKYNSYPKFKAAYTNHKLHS